jgi:hypothetical protein
MPKNLIRERKIPTHLMTNLQSVNPEWNHPIPGSVELPFYEGKYQLPQQNNLPDGYPFYPRNILTKETKYISYDMMPSNKKVEGEYSKRYNDDGRSMSRVGSEPKYVTEPKREDRA